MFTFVSRLGRLPIAPFAIPILVSTPIWSRNILRLAYQDMLPTVIALLAIVAILLIGIRLFVKTWMQASLIALIWVGYMLYLPPFVRFFTSNHWVLLIAIAGVGLMAWDLSRRVPADEENLSTANGFANIVAWCPALLALWYVGSSQLELERGRPDPLQIFAPLTGKADAQSPDVWHIVMDRYAGQTTLVRDYDYDNSSFLAALRKRGFAVADDAHSNYQITPLSLASTLNASYLDGYARKLGRQHDLVAMFNAIDRNAAFDFFRHQGYEVIFSGGWADITIDNAMADRDINFRALSEVPRIVIGHSVPGVIAGELGVPYTNGRKDQCLRARYKFRQLRAVAAESGRKFVFAHFLVPHPPYALNADGSCRSLEEARHNPRKDNYAGQVRYANRELIKLIDAILAGPRPATIVIHADEGPYPAQFAFDEPSHVPSGSNGKNWLTSDPEVRQQKTSIIMALRHADGKTTEAPRTPVNLYPIILNRSFNAAIPIREDKTFMFADEPDLSKLTDISHELY